MARPLTITAYGNAQLDTAQSKFGVSSGLFDGSGDYLDFSTDSTWTFGSGDWTIEFFARIPATNTPAAGFLSGNDLEFYWQNMGSVTGNLEFQYRPVPGSQYIQIIAANLDVDNDTWYHIAAVKTGSSYYLYMNGNRVATGTVAGGTTLDLGNATLEIGRVDFVGTNYFNGWMDDFRVSNTARYTGATYTVPAATFIDDSNTLLLINFDGADGSTTFRDVIGITGAATMATDFQMAATPPSVIKQIASTIAGQSDLQAQPTGLIPATGLLASRTTASLTAKNQVAFVDPYYVIDGYADTGYFFVIPDQYQQYQTQTAITATGGYLGSMASSMASDFAQSTAATNITATTTQISSQTVTVATAQNIITPTGYYVVYDYWTDDYVIKIGVEPFILGDTSVSATAGRQLGGELSAASDFQISSVPGYQIPAESNLASDYAISSLGGLQIDIDRPTRTVTLLGDITTSNTKSKFGEYSIYCDSYTDRLEVSPISYFNNLLDTGQEWTYELWVYPQGDRNFPLMYVQDGSGNNLFQVVAYHNASTGKYSIGYFLGNFTIYNYLVTPQLTKNAWNHIVIERQSGRDIKVYVNGTAYPSGTPSLRSYDLSSAAKFTTLGYDSRGLLGYADEIRFSNTRRYSSGYQTQTTPFVNDQYTLLLINAEQGIQDVGIKTVLSNVDFTAGSGVRYSIDEILAADYELSGTAIVEIIPDANIFGQTAITINPDFFVGGTVTNSAASDLAFGIIPTATAGILFSIQGSLASDYSINFYAGQTHFGELNAITETAALFQANRIVGASLGALAETDILATVTHILGGVVVANAEYDFAVTMTYAEFGALLSFGRFQLTAEITLYKIDPFRTLIVPSETRRYQILQETRQETVVSEDRINIVRPETRDIKVSSETRVYKLPIPAIDVATNRRPG